MGGGARHGTNYVLRFVSHFACLHEYDGVLRKQFIRKLGWTAHCRYRQNGGTWWDLGGDLVGRLLHHLKRILLLATVRDASSFFCFEAAVGTLGVGVLITGEG
jgi:hypothetical protein